MTFRPATKFESKARIALIGPAGSGKTYTALTLAHALGSKVAVLDTENGSASKYADLFAFDVRDDLRSFQPAAFVEAVREAELAGYDVLVLDSLSHEWNGHGGALEMVDSFAVKEKGNKFGAWRHVTPEHQKFVDAVIRANLHVIATMRSKTEWVVEEVNGRKIPRKVGLAPVQRDGIEYEFDIVGELDPDNNLVVTKTRMSALSGAVFPKPDRALGEAIKEWLSGAPDTRERAPKLPAGNKPPLTQAWDGVFEILGQLVEAEAPDVPAAVAQRKGEAGMFAREALRHRLMGEGPFNAKDLAQVQAFMAALADYRDQHVPTRLL